MPTSLYRSLTPEQQAINAATWIKMLQIANKLKIDDQLPLTQRKQSLGSPQQGFCCLGFGCWLFDINYLPPVGFNTTFKEKVGLLTRAGDPSKYNYQNGRFNLYSLVTLNDNKNYSFQAIGNTLRKNYRFYFTEEVTEWLNVILPEMDDQDFITGC